MRTIISIEEITDEDERRVGGKSFVSASLAYRGLKIPAGLCVTTDVYQRFIDEFGLRERIMMELSRKKLEDMRWEEG
jgi:pyruvate,water dikinase